jgi:prevent-host-death family protein
VETIAISEFKARCLAVLEKVRRTGRPITVTRRGDPIAEVIPPSPAHREKNWLGSAIGTGEIVGDLVAPVSDASEWEVLSK